MNQTRSKDGLHILCRCGNIAYCLITGKGWMCKTCFDEAVKELEG